MTEIMAIDDDQEILAVWVKAALFGRYQVTARRSLQLEENKLGRYQLILFKM